MKSQTLFKQISFYLFCGLLLGNAAPSYGETNFSVDPASPAIDGYLTPDDVLTSGPTVSIQGSNLGLADDFFGVFSDNLNALSYGQDSIAGPLYFSVDRVTFGLPGTAVNSEALFGNGAAGDIFISFPPEDSNELFIDEETLGLTPGFFGDDVDALELEGKPHNSGIYFSIDDLSATNFLGADSSDILLSDGDNNFSIFAGFSDIGLEDTDDIDALVLLDVINPGTLDPGEDLALFSLSFFSTNILSGSFSSADILFTDFTGKFSRFASASDLGLDDFDELNALDTVKYEGNKSPSASCLLPSALRAKPVEGNIGNEYSYQPTVTDPDLDPLTFSLIESPQGMTIAADTGLLLWTPTGTQLGDNSVTIQVSDPEGLSDTQTFTVAVQEPTSNGAPFFISEPLTDFALAVPGTATGDVNPELISLSLADGEMATETVSIALPGDGTSTGGKADIVFVVDESGSMASEHEWLTDMVLQLDTALQNSGITDNRYSMIGYANITRILNQTAQVEISVFGPGNQLVYSQEFGDDFGQAVSKPLPEFDLLADGTYTVVVTPKDKTEVPLEYNFSAVVTDLPAVPLRNVNIPISGTVAPLAEETFTFDAPAGTQIFFDGLSTSADIRVRIVDPDGNNITGGFGINSDLGPFLLPKAETYSVIASDIRNVGGDFSFQILEFNSAATEIALDTEITGTIATGFATEVFQFEATGGQQLYFDSPGAKLIGADIYGPDNQLLGSGGNFRDFRANIPSDGTHTLILRSAIANPIDYSFKLVTPEIQTTTLAIGERVTSSLLEAGEQDLYLIEGVAGQQVVFDGIFAEPNPVLARLFSPSGVQISFESIGGRASAPFILPESGTYSLVLDAAEGDYSFQLLDVASDSTNITAGIATGAEVNVTFADTNRTQLYRIDGVAGQILDFEVLSNTGSFGGNWQLIGVDNTVLKSGALTSNFRVTLPSDGRYTLLLGESGTPFDMSFRIIDQTASDPGVTNPVTGEGAIAIGEIVSGTIENLADQDTYRFNGNAGQRLVFDGLGTSVFSANATLISPSGQTISSSSRGGDSSPFFLQESGEYTIVMSAANSGERAYPYSFRLLDLDEGATPVQLDTPVTGSLENGRFIQLYEINGSAGQELFFNGLTNTGTLNWQLLGPNNSKLQNFVYFGFQDFSVVLPDSDNYTLVLAGNSNDPIDFSFEVVTPERELQQFAYGEIITGSLSEPGETDIYQFSGTAGDQIWFDGLEDSNPGFTVSLVSPLGKRILGRQFFTLDTTTPITLSESGTYSLVVASGDSSASKPGRVTGDYSFQVLEFTPNISLPDSLAGSFNDKDESQVFQFEGRRGQNLGC